MVLFTRQSRESWAKNKAKELGKEYTHISLGETHASFMKEGKSGDFSAVQIRYPKSILSFTGELLIRIVTIAFWVLLGGGIGFLIGSILFGESPVMWIIIVIGVIIGGFWGFRESN